MKETSKNQAPSRANRYFSILKMEAILTFPRNVGELLPDYYIASHPTRLIFITIGVKISNPTNLILFLSIRCYSYLTLI
jgi:hypothetical protein